MTPQTLDLLDEAALVLRDKLAAKLSGEARYLALLAANAVAMARRELALEEKLEAARRALSGYSIAAIRAGDHDGDRVLYERLWMHAALRAYVANPDALTETERQHLLKGGA